MIYYSQPVVRKWIMTAKIDLGLTLFAMLMLMAYMDWLFDEAESDTRQGGNMLALSGVFLGLTASAKLSGIMFFPLFGVAAAGGSGGGIVSCQQVLERYFQHLRCQIFDMIPVTRFSRDYKTAAASAAGAALARHIADDT